MTRINNLLSSGDSFATRIPNKLIILYWYFAFLNHYQADYG